MRNNNPISPLLIMHIDSVFSEYKNVDGNDNNCYMTIVTFAIDEKHQKRSLTLLKLGYEYPSEQLDIV